MIVVIVVTGGISSSTAGTFVEALNADGTRLCLLPNLPSGRRWHTMSGGMVCGGWDARKSCIKFQNGAWKKMQFSLQQERFGHVSWTRSGGKSRLFGGRLSLLTSELVSESGSISGFPLKYKTE